MATTDELKNDGSAVKLGAVRQNPVTRGFAPNSAGGADASLASRVSQIPATGGAFPAPAPDGQGSTELGRNIGNTLSALPGASPALGAIRTLASASKVGGALDAVGGGAGALAAKVAPYGVPAAGLGAVAVASQPATPAAAVPLRPGATGSQTASAPVMQAAPVGALPPTETLVPNGGQSSTAGTGAGFASDLKIGNQMESDRLAQEAAGFAAQDRQVSVGQAQSDKVDQERAVQRANATLSSIMNTRGARMQKAAAAQTLKAVDERVLSNDRGAIDLRKAGMADQTARRGQDIKAGALRSSQQLAQARFGLDAAKDGRDATSAGFQSRAAGRIEALHAAYEAAKPEDKSALAEQLRVMTGKDKPAQWKAIALQGATDSMGNKTEGVLAAVNEQTGEVKRLDQGQGQSINTDARAVAIRDNQSLTREQKIAELKKIGFQ